MGTYFRKRNNLDQSDLMYCSTSDNTETITVSKLYSDIDKVAKDSDIDIIVHFASVIPKSFSTSTFKNTYLPNMKMMNYLFDFSIKNRIKKFINISSFGSMKDPDKFDLHDFYTMSKISGEHFCSLMETHGIQAASLRLSSPYGEYSRSKNVLNTFVEKALKDKTIEIYGTGRREQNFIYAMDIVRAIELCVEEKISGVYNIVSEENTTMLTLAKTIVKLTTSQSKIIVNAQPDPQEGYKPDYNYQRARNELNFKPRYPITQGITEYISWLQSR